MGRRSEDPVEYIVSFRVNAEEKELLERLAGELGLSVSQMVRKYFRSGFSLDAGRSREEVRSQCRR